MNFIHAISEELKVQKMLEDSEERKPMIVKCERKTYLWHFNGRRFSFDLVSSAKKFMWGKHEREYIFRHKGKTVLKVINTSSAKLFVTKGEILCLYRVQHLSESSQEKANLLK